MTIDQFNFAGKKAFVRVDFNVPLDENFNITDDNRMRAALPTLKKILADGGSIIIGYHVRQPREHRHAQAEVRLFRRGQKALEAVLQHEKRESSQQHAPVEHAVIDRQVRRADGERDGAQENDAHAA